jgi:tRNA-uridine 2-sulfurtransferase
VALGFDAVATGHYAQVVDGPAGRELHRAVDPAKDQSYVLGVLNAEQLARSFFPLGDSTKATVREEAAARGFAVARKPDSHDICFIPDGDTRAWLAARLGERPGELVDAVSGEVVGAHTGAHGFTVGQRRGLGLDRSALDGHPRYVVEIDAPANRVVIGTAELLGVDVIEGDHVRWCGPAPAGRVRVGAQVRAHGEEVPATAEVRPAASPAGATGSDAVAGPPSSPTLRVELDRSVRGVAPGQSVVLYDGTRVVGSATISATARA